MTFNDAIKSIVNEIPKDYVFDSHYVIAQLIKNYSDEYIRFIAQFHESTMPTFTAHQQIGLGIAELMSEENPLIRHEMHKSWSENIHGNSSECALWLKIR